MGKKKKKKKTSSSSAGDVVVGGSSNSSVVGSSGNGSSRRKKRRSRRGRRKPKEDETAVRRMISTTFETLECPPGLTLSNRDGDFERQDERVRAALRATALSPSRQERVESLDACLERDETTSLNSDSMLNDDMVVSFDFARANLFGPIVQCMENSEIAETDDENGRHFFEIAAEKIADMCAHECMQYVESVASRIRVEYASRIMRQKQRNRRLRRSFLRCVVRRSERQRYRAACARAWSIWTSRTRHFRAAQRAILAMDRCVRRTSTRKSIEAFFRQWKRSSNAMTIESQKSISGRAVLMRVFDIWAHHTLSAGFDVWKALCISGLSSRIRQRAKESKLKTWHVQRGSTDGGKLYTEFAAV